MFGSHILRALACLFLLSSLALVGCETLEKIDQKSDDLLDDINDPGSARSSSSHSSGSSSRSKGSGLSVVQRPRMSFQPVKDRYGNTVVIWGQTRSTSKTPGHDATMEAQAMSMAYTGKYEYITIQRSWRTATGRVSESGKIPDVIGVRHDGRVDAFEVKSDSDDEDDLKARLRVGMETLPEERRGEYDVITADPTMKGGLLSR